jgi:UDP-N-acetylmuramyl pentapeptide synthase
MIVGLPKNGLAVLNTDDENVAAFAEKTQAHVHTFGGGVENQVRLVSTEQSISGTTFTFQTHLNPIEEQFEQRKDQKIESSTAFTCVFPRYVLPAHFGYSLAAAVAVGHYFGITPEQSCRNLEKHYQLPPSRASLLQGINESYIIDSSYNSSAQAAADMLELLNTIAPGRKLALLGDIRELGNVAQEEHELVAKRAAALCDEVILIGPQMKQYALPIVSKTKTPVQWFASAQAAAAQLKKVLQPQDTLLVKGSQNTLLLEIAVELLLADPSTAEQLLCRRGAFWDQERGKLVINTNRNEK